MVKKFRKKKKNVSEYGGRKIIDTLVNFKKDVLTLPNLLTAMRIFLVPFVLFLMWYDTPVSRFWSWIFYTIAATTDFFDGYVARKQGSVTVTGKLLDPLADKFIVNLTLVLLASMSEIHVLPVIVILAREFYIFGIRSVAIERGLVIAAGQMGKLKTTFQMFALPFFMLNANTLKELINIEWNPQPWGYVLIWASIFFSLTSAYSYSKKVKSRIFK
ncbi:MAG: CDP-diacylglycerol--glycerol-3-phosphate 3-phosphatidyltransferase [bacterium]